MGIKNLIKVKLKNLKIIMLFTLLISVFSCSNNTEFIDYKSVNGSWHKDSIQKFQFELQNSKEENYKTYINLRINDNYKFSNIFLIVSIKNNLRLISRDTLEFKLAEKSGKFTGNRTINLIENSLIHKENILLKSDKKYFVSIEHAMRIINNVGGLEYLDGIIDIGYKIEKIN